MEQAPNCSVASVRKQNITPLNDCTGSPAPEKRPKSSALIDTELLGPPETIRQMSVRPPLARLLLNPLVSGKA
ncbi:hypothetical protein UY3_15179 [Chelonia mydas]|uniref:Uncharacterized protein n=1 Tax=Chelonia mydas TaxID=8469 RepID=M7AQY4_CHEMY|nr:hypothetical protein UY3_15179 [Chelonia mydas]